MKTLLAKLCANRFVTYSPDGVLHLTWRQCTMHIMRLDLVQVVKFLELIQAQLRPGFRYGDACCQVSQEAQDQVEVWLWGVGFMLTTQELGELLLLGQMAIRHAQTIEQDPVRILVDPELPTYPEMVLSLN
ncbi:MAG: hypothetical protein KF832_28815 [Caldilineaceae bacterium]|nr:hypothetical protein [Caldilineaceae bacterium]